MNALVPYTAGNLRAVPYMSRGISRSAYLMARMAASRATASRLRRARGAFAFANSNFGSYAGRKIVRAAKRGISRRKRMRRVGEPTGRSTCKRDRIESVSQTEDTRTLYSTAIIQNIEQVNTATETINTRQRDIINVRGIKFCFEARNNNAEPLNLNIALVCVKGRQDEASTSEFFRSSTDQRSMSFNTSRSALEFKCSPINADRYTVLFHKRWTLGPNDSTGSYVTNNNSNYRLSEFYQPVKRQVRFEGPVVTNGEVYLLHWCDYPFRNGGDPATAGALTWSQRMIIYFREPRN